MTYGLYVISIYYCLPSFIRERLIFREDNHLVNIKRREYVCYMFSLNIFYFNQYEKGLGKKFYQHYIKPSP